MKVKKFPHELKFTAKGIADMEKRMGQSLQMLVGDISLTSVAHFISVGLDKPLSKAYDLIDDYLTDGGDFEEMYREIVRVLKKRGLLMRAYQAIDMDKKLDEMTEQAIETSESYGKEGN
jgi:hypothetical protein